MQELGVQFSRHLFYQRLDALQKCYKLVSCGSRWSNILVESFLKQIYRKLYLECRLCYLCKLQLSITTY